MTHGSPRQHIWSFGGGFDEVVPVWTCPCVTGSTAGDRIPSFVGRNYFCEAGLTLSIMVSLLSGQMVIPCGMDRGVVPLAPVAPSTHHHGSMYNCLLPQPMTSRSGSVVMKELQMKILRYKSLNST